jgi:hypothetical protein
MQHDNAKETSRQNKTSQPAQGFSSIKKWMIGLLCVLIVLIAARLSLPYWILNQLNDRLRNLDGYYGRVDDIDVLLITGAYTIHNLVIERQEKQVKVPFLAIPETRMSISWEAIFEGRIEGEIEMSRPEVNFVDAPTEQQRQTGLGPDWSELVEDFFPFVINRIEIYDGKIHFRNFHSEPVVDVQLLDVQALIANLRNRAIRQSQRDAEVRIDARAEGKGDVEIRGTYEWLGRKTTFDMDFRLQNMPATAVADITQAYLGFDAASGELNVVAEIKAKNGVLDGYVKPLFKNLEIINIKQDVEEQNDNIFVLMWETLTGFIAEVFENQPRDQFATRIPISGTLDDVTTENIPAIVEAIKNAFVKALDQDMEEKVNLPTIEKGEK